jgi:hypothetical protein
MNKSVGINPFVALLAIFTFGSLFGLVGVILAVPLAAVFQFLLDRYVLQPSGLDWQIEAGRDKLSRLRYYVQDLIQDIQKQIREFNPDSVTADDQRIEEELEAIAVALENLLAEEED